MVRERCSHGGALCLRKGCINTAIHALNSPNAEVFANYLAHGAIGVAYKDPGEPGGEEDTPKQASGPNLRQAYDPLSGPEMGIAGICVLQNVSPTNRVAEVIGQSGDSFSPRPEGLTEFDVRNLKTVLGHEISRNTMTNYRVQWRNFLVWAAVKGVPAFPAAPEQVAAYLAQRIEECDHKPATLRMAASAIAYVHKTAGMDDPCASPEVRRTLKSATRKAGKSQKQAEALTDEAMDAIRLTARNPRIGRGGRLESPETATRRGGLDIALVGLMRDGLLRVSEAAALVWNDLGAEPDGTGRLLVRRSKTDADGAGVVLFVSASTMADLRAIRNNKADSDSIFGLRPNQISKRIKAAAKAAGLGEGFSGHSPRVGMARDLASFGVELPCLMTAGRWRTPAMPAHYVRNESAGKGAVAQFHGYRRRVA